MATISRRELVQGILGTTAASLVGCHGQTLPLQGELLGQNFAAGHRLREPISPNMPTDQLRTTPIVIVGGGIAGLAAGWRLLQAGRSDFVILELEDHWGGTSRSGQSGQFQYPWAAHYITTPLPENRQLIELLSEMGVVERMGADGVPEVAEQFLCREPEERVYYDGLWHEGLYPGRGASSDELQQLTEFKANMLNWAAKRDSQGRRYFTIPMAKASDVPEVLALDQISMQTWMNQQGWDSPRLHWYVDYACRDDYGLTHARTSAWAGILYFAARMRPGHSQAQDVITWPSGNGQIVQYLVERLHKQLHRSCMVRHIAPPASGDPQHSTAVFTCDDQGQPTDGYWAQRVIFAAPQFVAPHVIAGFRDLRPMTAEFQYSSWLVANVHLKDRPQENGFPLCWDNVLYDSKSLGYVVATHQLGLDHGPTVLTWYYPFADERPAESREQLLKLEWAEWADLVLTDLEAAHPDVRRLTQRIDVMRWGHAMVQPRTGFIFSSARREASRPDRSIHFANTDLSGIALMEEAFYHGVRAADEVLTFTSA